MIVAALASALLQFGGISFGATEETVRTKVAEPLREVQLADGSRGVTKDELIAGRVANRTWIIRNGMFVEGVLVFSFTGDSNSCQQLHQTALSSIEANYGNSPKLVEKKDSGPNGTQFEFWIVTLEGGARIEQRLVYAPLIASCTVGGRYFPPADKSLAF